MPDPKPRRTYRCAIYTRKSSEEGLEQDFNSLQAQREACEAYVASQRHEGWKNLTKTYDDGGFSGGSIERPALRQLLTDIEAGEIDIVVVYKVDRLTRALSDFARIVEIFDRHGVSFVSVTQAFNTTTSMGRLTLNVLLSFAQFEREVTGERIRDKIAASKKKGLWMGGFVPLGYEADGRTLKINPNEAETIQTIFSTYLALKSVDRLKQELDRLGVRTKPRVRRDDTRMDGHPISRGHCYRILSNPLYVGRIRHKGKVYDGLHPPIIDQATFDAVQALLAENSHERLVKAHSKHPSLLAGLLVDAGGEKLVATHCSKQGRRYRYYISASALRWRSRTEHDRAASPADHRPPCWRLPAAEIEGCVIRILVAAMTDDAWLSDHVSEGSDAIDQRRRMFERSHGLADKLASDDAIAKRGILLALVSRIQLAEAQIEIAIRTSAFAHGDPASDHVSACDRVQRVVTLSRAVQFRKRGIEVRLIIEGDPTPQAEPDPALIKALAQAHRWWRDLLGGRYLTLREIAKAYDSGERYVAWVLRLAFLSPDMTRRILDGTQPVDFTLSGFLAEFDFPVAWADQKFSF